MAFLAGDGLAAVKRKTPVPAAARAAAKAKKKTKGALRVEVVNPAGKPAGRAHVRLVWRVSGRRHVLARRVNRSGNIVVRGLGARSYLVRASGAHRTHGAAAMTVASGAMSSVVIDLKGRVKVMRTAADIAAVVHRRTLVAVTAGKPTHNLFELGRMKLPGGTDGNAARPPDRTPQRPAAPEHAVPL